MAKNKTIYRCNQCAAESSRWSGQCHQCQAWNTLSEEAAISSSKTRLKGYAAAGSIRITPLNEVNINEKERYSTGLTELDRVLGGGLVTDSVVLIGGDPGIGKSTILLQTTASLSQDLKTLYVTGEESLQQVRMRSRRLGLKADAILLLAETQVETILNLASVEKPDVIVIDSVQTI